MNHRASNYPNKKAEAVARKAKKLASSEHVDWKNLSQEERSHFKRRIRGNDQANPERRQDS